MTAILEIDLLRTFHTVARLKKFKAAALHLHKSAAAISVHIQRLESTAGGRLLERDNQGVTLTALGSRLFAITQELLAAHDRALLDLRGSATTGTVKLGVPDEYVVHVIQDILPLFSATWPNIVLEVTTAPSRSLCDWVAQGLLDLVVVARLVGEGGGSCLQRTTPVWVAGANTLADANAPLPLALYAAPCPYREAMTGTLERAGIAWRAVLDTPSGAAVKTCVEAGLAVSVVDRSRLTPGMRVRNDLPALPEHEISILHAPQPSASIPAAVALLSDAIGQRFRL